MKRTILLLLSMMFLFSNAQRNRNITEIIVLGMVHFATKQINADTIYAAIKKIQPDIILLELDSSFFTSDFSLKKLFDENEITATAKYIKGNPKCILRPFDIEGRNEYRQKTGLDKIDNIFTRIGYLHFRNALSPASRTIWQRFTLLKDSLNNIGNSRVTIINTTLTDNITAERQFYQYKKLKEITDSEPEFSKSKIFVPGKDSMTYKDLYAHYVYFEEFRNRTMVQNILQIAHLHPAKRILVLTGFYHRYFLVNELLFYEKKYPFTLKEYNSIPPATD